MIMENKITTNKLDEKHKHEIMQMLAAFAKPANIVENLKAQFDVVVTENDLLYIGKQEKEKLKLNVKDYVKTSLPFP